MFQLENRNESTESLETKMQEMETKYLTAISDKDEKESRIQELSQEAIAMKEELEKTEKKLTEEIEKHHNLDTRHAEELLEIETKWEEALHQ